MVDTVDMPIYEYACSSCKKYFEMYATSYKDLDTLEGDRMLCPYCKGYADRMPSAPASIQFKGDGWMTPTHKDTSE